MTASWVSQRDATMTGPELALTGSCHGHHLTHHVGVSFRVLDADVVETDVQESGVNRDFVGEHDIEEGGQIESRITRYSLSRGTPLPQRTGLVASERGSIRGIAHSPSCTSMSSRYSSVLWLTQLGRAAASLSMRSSASTQTL